ncbi:MAG: protease inhibitor I42 family protein [Spirochaetaceae bacterium]|nr:protease inhibitor I42 family protein [Spirochaetaceae bacterium]
MKNNSSVLKSPILILIMLVALLMISCETVENAGSSEKDGKNTAGTFAAKETEKTEKILAENEFTVTLAENPTTGFSWQYEIQDKSAVKLVDDEYVPSNTDKRVTGSGGMHSFTFACLKDCDTSVTMTYRRPWKGGETAEKRLIRIKYKKDDNLSWELEKVQGE